MTLTDVHKSVLAKYIAEGEKVKDAVATGDRVLAVTDRRVIEVRETASENREIREVRDTLITGEQVQGTTVKRTSGKDTDDLTLWMGGLILSFGILLIPFAPILDISGVVGTGLLAALIGLVIVIHAYNNDDGEVELSVRHENEDQNVGYVLPVNELKFAQSVSKAVGAAHEP